MGKWIAIVLGVILLGLGIWGIWAWRYDYIWPFIAAGLALAAVVVGVGAIAFGWSEIRSAAEERRIAESAPPPPSAPPQAPPAASGESSSDTSQTPPSGSA